MSELKFTEIEKEAIIKDLKAMSDPDFFTCCTLFHELFSHSKELLLGFNKLWIEESNLRFKAIGLNLVPMPV